MSQDAYKTLAPFYGILVKLVFGRELFKAKTYFLRQIEVGSKVLIIGAGKFEEYEILKEKKLNPLTVIEPSKGMSKGYYKSKIEHHTVSWFNYDSDVKYDYIILPFILDCFNLKELRSFLLKLNSNVHAKTELFVSDFYIDLNLSLLAKFYRKVLVRIMYLWFYLFTGLKNKRLQDFPAVLEEFGWYKKCEHHFNRGFVRAWIFSKN